MSSKYLQRQLSLRMDDGFTHISWEEFMTNQDRLRNNAARHKRESSGVVRKAQTLFQGIAVCGRCARQMGLHYSGPKGTYPVYKCEGDYSMNGTPSSTVLQT